MSLHREDALEDLPMFEKTRRRNTYRRARGGAGQRQRQCIGKLRFASQKQTKSTQRHWGQRVYFCDLCNGWHLTKRDAPK